MKEYSESKVTRSSYSMLALVTKLNLFCRSMEVISFRYYFNTDVLSFREAEDTWLKLKSCYEIIQYSHFQYCFLLKQPMDYAYQS